MFELWKLKRDRKKSVADYELELISLRKSGASRETIAEKEHDAWVDSIYLDQIIDMLVSRRLIDEAVELDVSIPDSNNAAMWARNEGGRIWLSSEGRALLRRSIDEEKSRRFEVKTLWVVKFIVPVASILVGLIGALTGLIAVWHRK
jgi:hypothetical protein